MADLVGILVHLGSSVDQLMRFVSGACYLLSVLMIWTAIKRMKKIADQRARAGPGGQVFIPLAYFMGGMTLLFLPTMIDVATNTFFGVNSPLAYESVLKELKQKYGDGSLVMIRLVQFAGIVWFIRGTVLLVQASEPGVQRGPKGLAFLVGGIFALNIKYTLEGLSKILGFITTGTI